MTNTIKSWDVIRGDVSFLGPNVFDPKDMDRFGKDEKEAIRSLSQRVLESKIGREKASHEYALHGRVTFAVGFSDQKGLCIVVNGTPHQVATAKEVYAGELSVLPEIKKIQAAVERQNIGKVSDSLSAELQAPSLSKTDEKIKNIYKEFIDNRVEEPKSRSLINRARVYLQGMWGSADIFSVVRNMIGCVAPAAATAFGAFAIAGGTALCFGGITLALSGADAFGLAVCYKSREKAALALMDIITGLSALVTGLCFIIQHCAQFAGHLLISAAAGAVLPFAALCLYVVSLASSIYKLYVGYTFRSELKEILGKNGDKTKLVEALKWMRQKTELSEIDLKEHQEKGGEDEANFADRIVDQLHQKWDRFATRVGGEVFTMIHEELKGSNLDALIAGLESGDSKAEGTAQGLIQGILEKNKQQLKWNIISIISSIIGLFGIITVLAFAGIPASSAASALFVIAAAISVFVDSPKIRALAWEFIGWLRETFGSIEKIKSIVTAALAMNFISSVSEGQRGAHSLAGRVVDFAAQIDDERLRSSCLEFWNKVKVGSCTDGSTTSLTSLAPKEGLPQIQLRPTGEILPHSQAS